MMYHQVVRMYQKAYRLNPDAAGVPLILFPPNANYSEDKDAKGRGKLSEVYVQMVQDLNNAIDVLTNVHTNKGYINHQNVRVDKGEELNANPLITDKDQNP